MPVPAGAVVGVGIVVLDGPQAPVGVLRDCEQLSFRVKGGYEEKGAAQMKARTFSVFSPDNVDQTERLKEFATAIGLDEVTQGRYSILLNYQLFVAAFARTLNPAKVLDSIRSIETPERPNALKPATKFKGPYLAGLWHKHYLPDGIRPMAINLRKGIIRDGLPWLENQVAQATENGVEKYLTEEDINLIVDDAVRANWERLNRRSEITGEWVIYARHKGENYYLCLAKHTDPDEGIRKQIDLICAQEFPFLNEILSKI